MPVFLYSVGRQGFENHTKKLKKAAKKKKTNPRFPTLILCLTALIDSTVVALETVALLLVPPSINQIMRGGTIIFTAIFSRVILKREIFGFQGVGVLLCALGLTFGKEHFDSQINFL